MSDETPAREIQYRMSSRKGSDVAAAYPLRDVPKYGWSQKVRL
jgi:hypothetical protein